MAAKFTQEQCRERWEALKKEMHAKIKEIDNDTPWSEFEPKWWLEMNTIQRSLILYGAAKE